MRRANNALQLTAAGFCSAGLGAGVQRSGLRRRTVRRAGLGGSRAAAAERTYVMRREGMPELPRFRVRKIERDPVRLIGELSSTRYGSESWVEAGWLGDLRVGNRFVTGRWSQTEAEWVFSPERASALDTIGAAREFPVFEGYWGERAELVLDESLAWSSAKWGETADHDHCRICWASINSEENTVHYAASPNLRVCAACYSSYVQPRSVDFRELGGPAA